MQEKSMPETTRDQIIAAADQLFYERGYEHTSFGDIAEVVHISRGNFYYHFKTKDEILDAVIALRIANTKRMLKQWEAEGEHPRDRIRSFVQILMTNRAKIMRYGCPVGTLCSELAKLNHASQADANKLFTIFRSWLRHQFTLLACGGDADALAMHLLARSQGVSSLANTFPSEEFIRREVEEMHAWLDRRTEGRGGTLSPAPQQSGKTKGSRRLPASDERVHP
jgi:TetR/AcrR family transcriptional repressor of nem operon